MIDVISHRGNIDGPNSCIENHPDSISKALEEFDVEIDLWQIDKSLVLGHDEPEFEINSWWLQERTSDLWVHCKNVEALCWCRDQDLNAFFHTDERVVLTTRGFMWFYPQAPQPYMNMWSVLVLPETLNLEPDALSGVWTVCTDYPYRYATKS